jgi:tRNA-Thr(GGU) m(6)t(6)A37 methyltransferase TsaA
VSGDQPFLGILARDRWTSRRDLCHRRNMTEQRPEPDGEIRPGEVAVTLPGAFDAGVYFIGTIHTPWKTRAECPRRGSADGPVCAIVLDERWRQALSGLTAPRRIQVLYWMDRARRDLVVQSPIRAALTTGTFALRSPVRPNPIASSVVDLLAVEDGSLRVRGLDCLDGTPLIDLKPDHGPSETTAAPPNE